NIARLYTALCEECIGLWRDEYKVIGTNSILADIRRAECRNTLCNVVLHGADHDSNGDQIGERGAPLRIPLLRNPPQRRVLVELQRFLAREAQLAVGGDAAGKHVVHQARLDRLRLRDQRLSLLDGLIEREEDFTDAPLLE